MTRTPPLVSELERRAGADVAHPPAGGQRRNRSTAPADDGLRHARRTRAVRRSFLAVMALVVLAGATSLLGVHRGTVVDHGDDGAVLTVEYPRITRPGLAVPLRIRLEHPGGFDGPVTLELPSGYLRHFDFMDLSPGPDAESDDGVRRTLRYDAPDGDTLLVVWDVRAEPGEVGRFGGDVAARIGDRLVAEVSFRSWFLP